MVLRGHLSKANVLFQPKLSLSSKLSRWTTFPQGNIQAFEKDVPSLSLWSKALGNLSLLCLRGHIVFQVCLSLTHDRCRVSSMTPTRAITPTVPPLNHFLSLIFNLSFRRASVSQGLLARYLSSTVSGIEFSLLRDWPFHFLSSPRSRGLSSFCLFEWARRCPDSL